MNEPLVSVARRLLDAAPCSVEMPAGTGKTHVLAAAAALAAADGKRSLILTHTNAGVDAIRKRLKRFGVLASLFRVDTITSWAFSLVRSYSDIAGITVSGVPDWTESDRYLKGATAVARSRSMAEVHAISFDYLLVDEYQDCTLVLHDFLSAIASAIPKTVVLGDRLQAVFTFVGPMASWDEHVLPAFPAHDLEAKPHRWTDHNLDLGRWLVDIRPQLVSGQTFDLASHAVPGVTYVAETGPSALAAVAHGFRDFNETVVLLDKWPNDVALHASRLGGSFTVMEDMSGKFMHSHLQRLPSDGNYLLASWFARFSKDCIIGLAGIDAPILSRLEKNEGITHYGRPGLEAVIAAFDQLRQTPTYAQLALTSAVIRDTQSLRVYRWEAWGDTQEAIRLTADNGGPASENLARVREKLRRTGRRSSSRIASRTLLVKGLEYDHVVIADLSKFRDPCNLYVALSRARKSVTILGVSPQVSLRAGA